MLPLKFGVVWAVIDRTHPADILVTTKDLAAIDVMVISPLKSSIKSEVGAAVVLVLRLRN